MTTTTNILTWTKHPTDQKWRNNYEANGPDGGRYVANVTPGRRYVLVYYAPDGPAFRLGKSTLAACKELAEAHAASLASPRIVTDDNESDLKPSPCSGKEHCSCGAPGCPGNPFVAAPVGWDIAATDSDCDCPSCGPTCPVTTEQDTTIPESHHFTQDDAGIAGGIGDARTAPDAPDESQDAGTAAPATLTMPAAEQRTTEDRKVATATVKTGKKGKTGKPNPKTNGHAPKSVPAKPKLVPRPRPDDLPDDLMLLDSPPAIELGDDHGPRAILDWIEAMRDHYREKSRQWATAKALRTLAEKTYGPEVADTVRTLLRQPPPVPGYKEKPPKAGKGKVKKIKKTGKPKTAPDRSAKNGGPPANGTGGYKHAPTFAKTPKLDNKTDVPVEVTRQENGRLNIDIDGHGLRAVIRWMGADGWTTEQITAVLGKLGILSLSDGYTAYLTNAVITRYANAGRAHATGGKTWHGPPADVSAKTAKMLRALRK